MPRILTRPLFRKGGLSKTPRPSYRGGGVTAIRPGYRGGGMNGIMSGIVPRRGYAAGPKTLEDYQNISKIQMLGKPKSMEEINKEIAGLGEPTPWWKFWDWSDLKGMGESTQDYVARTQWEKSPEYKQSERKRLIDERNKLIEQRKEVGLETKTALPPGEVGGPGYVPKITTGGTVDGGAGTGQSDLESLQDYMKMFEAAAGRPSTQSKWLELAKAGSNLMAQPGGDLIGAIGKAATPSLEGLSKEMAADKAAKQSARLMGLKAGLEQMDMGEFGKKISTLSKLTGKSKKAIAEKFISGDTDFDAEYLAAAEASGVEAGHSRKIYLENIKIMSDKHPDIAAQLNKPFPKKKAVEGEYYVLPNGKFTRWVDGEKLKPTDPGFYDKEA